jgi:hypothetical protein
MSTELKANSLSFFESIIMGVAGQRTRLFHRGGDCRIAGRGRHRITECAC